MKLVNKTAIITAAGSELGRTISLALAQEGANILCVDADAVEAEVTVQKVLQLGGKALLIQADIQTTTGANAVIQKAEAQYGSVDILVNSDMILSNISILESTVEEWDHVMDVNLRGTFFCMQAAARAMIKRNAGKIVNIVSILGCVASPCQAAASASMAGVLALTRTSAAELGPSGIYVNAVALSCLDTREDRQGIRYMKQEDMEPISLRRQGLPEDIIGAVMFLVSHESDYVNGTTITVDGGWASWSR